MAADRIASDNCYGCSNPQHDLAVFSRRKEPDLPGSGVDTSGHPDEGAAPNQHVDLGLGQPGTDEFGRCDDSG
jgi:hypothetical protein